MGDCFQSWFTFSTCKLLFAPGDRWKALSEEEKDKYRNLSRADFEKARKQCLDASVPLRPSQLQQSGSTTSEVETSSPEVPTEDMVYLGNVHRIVDHAHGKGSYGTVYTVLHTPSFRFLAAKVETVGTSLKHEIQMLSPLSHPNLLPVLQSNFVPNGLSWFIMPFVETSLYTLLQKQALTINSQLGLALQLVDALSYLHSNNIVHCDIKPGNILCDMSTISSSLTSVLQFFGQSRPLAKDAVMKLIQWRSDLQSWSKLKILLHVHFCVLKQAPKIPEDSMKMLIWYGNSYKLGCNRR